MGGTIFDGFLRVSRRHQSINKPAREAVAPSHAVEDLKVRILRGCVELAARPTNGAPVVDGGGPGGAQGRGSDLEIRERLHGRLDHRLECRDVEMEKMFIGALDLEAEAGC